MKNIVLSSAFILSSLSLGEVAYACDMHGGGFGAFGMGNANWQTFNPKASTFDPAYRDNVVISPMDGKELSQEKSKPSFSNAANIAALRAKARLAKKTQDTSAHKSDEKAVVKKASLNADR